MWTVRSLKIGSSVNVSYSAYDFLSTFHKICVPLFYGSAILLEQTDRRTQSNSMYRSRVASCRNTRRPASADRTTRRQFQATGQPLSRTQANDAMTSRLPRYEVKCAQRRCFECGSVPLRSDVKGTELPGPANILIPLERQLIALQLCS